MAPCRSNWAGMEEHRDRIDSARTRPSGVHVDRSDTGVLTLGELEERPPTPDQIDGGAHEYETRIVPGPADAPISQPASAALACRML